MSQKQAVLLLGGGGFVGRHLTRLLAEKRPVYVLSRQISHLPALKGVTYLPTSLADTGALQRVLPECGVVFHLASDSTPGTSARQPMFETTHNLNPSLQFLTCLQDFPNIHLIHLSSGGAIYGDPDEQFVIEDAPLKPLSYYGAGKVALEAFITAFCHQCGATATTLRPSNLYGPGQDYRPGFGIIPTILHYQKTGKTLEIWGDGETVRDYLYIEDFMRLCQALLTKPQEGKGHSIYNAGSGWGHSLNQLCATVEQVTGQTVAREYHPARSVDVRRVVLDSGRLASDYNWKAQTSLYQGLEKTHQWFNA